MNDLATMGKSIDAQNKFRELAKAASTMTQAQIVEAIGNIQNSEDYVYQEYPKSLYGPGNLHVIVHDQIQERRLKKHFCSPPSFSDETKDIHVIDALTRYGISEEEAAIEFKQERREQAAMKKEAARKLLEEAELEEQELIEPPKSFEGKPDIERMGKSELVAYARFLNQKNGVEIPLKAKREEIENKIRGVLNGGNDQRLDNRGLSQA